MIKECKIKLNNDYCTVVEYDANVNVQLPAIKKDIEMVFVKYEDGRYSVVNNLEDARPKRRKIVKKKTTEHLNEKSEEQIRCIVVYKGGDYTAWLPPYFF